MRILLTAINAKYIHSNLAVYSLRAAAREFKEQVDLAEFTINHRPEVIFGEIYRKKPDLLLFSCYIWNRLLVLETAENIKKVLPDTVIWAGGPEVSWDAELFLQENPQFDGVMIGEGERTFYRLLRYYEKCFALPSMSRVGADSDYFLSHGTLESGSLNDRFSDEYTLEKIPGIAWRERGMCEEAPELSCEALSLKRNRMTKDDLRRSEPPYAASGKKAGPESPSEPSGKIRQNPPSAPEHTLDALPFVYQTGGDVRFCGRHAADLQEFENRIIYYESSRGCPFSCSYCLSSLEKTVRFRSLELVKKELAFFLEHRVRQVKFVDRTFNCSHARTAEIWRFLMEHDNGVTNFHFEISADLLNDEELSLLAKLRPGLVQLEIGVQTVNPETLAAIHRKAPFEKIAEHVRRIAASHNIHQHLDLIAGLPFEDYESFGRSFDAVYALRPQELQLGFLKVLRGSEMQKRAGEYGIVYRSEPPYEVLQTRWISCGELLRLKEIEEMLEVYYNSHQFDRTIAALEQEYARPFALYEALASFYRAREEGRQGQRSYTRMQRLELLREFAREIPGREDCLSAGADPEPEKSVREVPRREDRPAGTDPELGKSAREVPEQGCREGAETAPERAEAEPDREAESALKQRMLRYDRLLIQDLYLRENAKTRPAWAENQGPLKDSIIGFYKEEEQTRRYLPHYQGRIWKQLMKMTHLEYAGEGKWLLFDYEKRDPLNYAADVTEIRMHKEGT